MSQAVAILLLCVFTMNTVLAQYGEPENPPPEENPCNLVDCIPNTRCIVENGVAKCLELDFKESNNTTCPTNEEFKTCGTACEPSCRNPNPEFCTQQCVVGCQCKSGFYRNDQNVCVARCSNDTTSTPGNTTCPTNEEFKECGTACEPSCRNPNPEVCTEQCVRGCQCRSGYYRNDENVCVSNCSEKYNPCAATTCPVGSECRPRDVVCVRAPCDPVAECVPTKQDPQCNQNESYRSCASQCEPTCSNKNPTCILSCAPGRCQCNIGFYRNSSGSCVTEADCDGNTNPY